MKIAFFTLGCKVNQYETKVLEDLFVDQNFQLVDCFCFADIYILNSCTVTANTDSKIKSIALRFKKINSSAILVLTGCFVQAFGANSVAESSLFSLFDVVVGNSNKFELPVFVKEFLLHRKKIVAFKKYDKLNRFPNFTISKFKHRFRAFLKIEDGCNRACSYCAIPRARGSVRSKPLEVLKFEVNQLVKNGYCEIVLVGINLSSYGYDFEGSEVRLVDAVRVVSSFEKVKRIRLGSLEPDLLSEADLICLSKIEKFCPNFHLALQSGSDSVLKRMHRKYDTEQYLKLIDLIFKFFKNPSITTDIMVGFPQETDFEFLESVSFVSKVGFLRVHIFPYSRRPKTLAALMDGQLTEAEKKIRVHKMKEVVTEETRKFLISQIGKVLEVLFEKKEGFDVFVGHSKNYCVVKVKSSVNLCGIIKNIKIEEVFENFCFGIVLKI